MTRAQAVILIHMVAGRTLTQSLVGDRLWSLLEDPFTVFDDVSPRLLLAGRCIKLVRPGSLDEDRPDAYEPTAEGRAAVAAYRASHPDP